MKRDLEALRYSLTERELETMVYDNQAELRNFANSLIENSAEGFEKLSEFKNLATYSAVRIPVSQNACLGIEVCGLPLVEVGCGIMAFAEGLAESGEVITHDDMEVITRIVEEKGYYLKGSGTYWHLFRYFTYPASHWWDVIDAIRGGQPVTVLLKYPQNTRNWFTNIIATENLEAEAHGSHNMPITDPESYRLYTSDGRFFSLRKLLEPGFLVTAPWVWTPKF